MKREVAIPEEYLAMEMVLKNLIIKNSLICLDQIGREIAEEYRKTYESLKLDIDRPLVSYEEEERAYVNLKLGYFNKRFYLDDILKRLLYEMGYDEDLVIDDGVLRETLDNLCDSQEDRLENFFKYLIYDLV